MNCNCVERLNEKIKAHEADRHKKPIKSVELKGMMLAMPTMKRLACSTFLIELEGQKKLVEINVANSFCSFCGVKTEKDEDGKGAS